MQYVRKRGLTPLPGSLSLRVSNAPIVLMTVITHPAHHPPVSRINKKQASGEDHHAGETRVKTVDSARVLKRTEGIRPASSNKNGRKRELAAGKRGNRRYYQVYFHVFV